MIVYLAAAYSRISEMRDVREELKPLGVTVNSRWLEETVPPPNMTFDRFLRQNALIDLADVRAADMLIRFSDWSVVNYQNPEPIHPGLASGARMVEMGVALEAGKPVVVVGGQQNVFDRLPQVVHVADLETLKRFLNPAEAQ